jgi:hypothetical protein
VIPPHPNLTANDAGLRGATLGDGPEG